MLQTIETKREVWNHISVRNAEHKSASMQTDERRNKQGIHQRHNRKTKGRVTLYYNKPLAQTHACAEVNRKQFNTTQQINLNMLLDYSHQRQRRQQQRRRRRQTITTTNKHSKAQADKILFRNPTCCSAVIAHQTLKTSTCNVTPYRKTAKEQRQIRQQRETDTWGIKPKARGN